MTRTALTNKPTERRISGVFAKSIRASVLCLMAAAILVFASGAKAASLNLIQQFPDIASTNILTTYAPGGANNFLAAGSAVVYNDGVNPSSVILPTLGLPNWNISATIDNAGNASAGSLSITGLLAPPVAGQGGPTNTLLTGTLSAFGFPGGGGGDPLEFLFTVTGGDLAALMGTPVGVILNGTGFSGSFDTAFTGSSGTADTFAVPIPGAAWLFGSGLLGLLGVGRWRRHRRA